MTSTRGATKTETPPIEKLSVDAETLGNMTLALGAASRTIVPGASPTERAELDADLDPSRVKAKPGSGMSYLTEHDVVRTANRIFGYGRWGTTVVSHELIGERQMKNAKGEDGWYVGYRCTVRLSVAGCVPVDGVGYGDAFEKQWSAQITAHELACKEAESDAIKRAFKKFGDQFGLILYAKADDKKRIADEKAAAAYNEPATQEQIEAVEAKAPAADLAEQVASAIKAEVDEHTLVRSGWLARLGARIDEVIATKTAGAAGGESETQATSSEPKLVEASADPDAKTPLAKGDRAATDDEIASLISLAGTLDTDTAALTETAIANHRAKMVDGVVAHGWLDRMAKALMRKLNESGSDFKPPASATGAATAGDVEAAFTEPAAA